MRSKVFYEWTAELIDADGDIIDPTFWDSLKDARTVSTDDHPGAIGVDVGLIRHVGNDVEGEIDREYVYLDEGGKLPEFFDSGYPVPKRYLKEAA